MSVALAIIVTGIGIYASRAVFILAFAQRRFPPLALRALEYVAPAVMGALVVTMLITPEGEIMIGTPEVVGLACAAFVIRVTRSHVYALVAALCSFWLAGYFF